ncbi:MAG: hypothetical protein HC880_00795 [Bacteroidia bacterium]|nr:hypothetical protein [Bacteroidia bacterium]
MLQAAIDRYFVEYKECRPTISGLVLFLGFCDIHSFYDYGRRPEFSTTIKNARERIVNIYEQMLGNANCTGAIFALKNFGWKDRIEIKTEQSITINVVEGDLSERAESIRVSRLCSKN